MALGILLKGVLTGTLDPVTKCRPCLSPSQEDMTWLETRGF